MKRFFSEQEVADIRHELRTCLNQVQGYRDLIQDEAGWGGAEQDAWLLEIEQQGDRLLQLITRFLRGGESAGLEVFVELAEASKVSGDAIRSRATALRDQLDQSGAAGDAGKILKAIDRWDATLATLLKPVGDSC